MKQYSQVSGASLNDFKADFDNMRPVFKAAQLEANKSIRKAMYLGFLEHEKTVTTMLDKIADSIFSMLFDMIASREATWTKARLLDRVGSALVWLRSCTGHLRKSGKLRLA